MADRYTCSSCRFFQSTTRDEHGADWGECRVGRPVVGSGWEGVAALAWCGEHEPLPEAAKVEEVKAEMPKYADTMHDQLEHARRTIFYPKTVHGGQAVALGGNLRGCDSCRYTFHITGAWDVQSAFAFSTHKCEDHQPANEESDS